MEMIRVLRGFRDIYGEEIDKFVVIDRVCRNYFELLGYGEMGIPILEKTELFSRSIGDTTDIVEKEMFTFTDRSGESLTLRPEATASMVRSYLQAGLHARERVSRLFTIGPMFRHERPQKGRFRQFHQVDVEVFGVAESILDAELIWMIFLILQELGVRNYAVEVNSVGCKLCREEFRSVLVSYLEAKRELLCDDCKNRLQRNPLRIFDCKSEGCIAVSKDSPLLFDYLDAGCREHFETCLKQLEAFKVPYSVNKRLVRGLDYYTRTVFEVTSEDLGAQKAFAAGGRYDNLVEEMGGPSTPASGFAIGMERLALLVPSLNRAGEPRCFLAVLGSQAEGYLVPLLDAFTRAKVSLAYAPGGKSLKSQMKFADSLKVDYVLILGDDEIARRAIILRDMKDGSQRELPLDVASLPEEIVRLTCAS